MSEIGEEELAEGGVLRITSWATSSAGAVWRRAWDKELRGADGGVQVEVDSTGRESKVLGELKAIAGNNLVLTHRLGAPGVRTAADGRQGVRRCNYRHESEKFRDPGDGIGAGVRPGAFRPWNQRRTNGRNLITDKRHPLEDKCISGQYAPGSTYKLITASAALEEGIIDEKTVLYCPGSFPYGGAVFSCYKAGGHGRHLDSPGDRGIVRRLLL